MTSAHGHPGFSGLLMSADEYASLGETPDRYELINGVVVMSPSPRPIHWLIVRELVRQIDASGVGAGVFADIDVFFDERTVYRPDLSVYRAGRLSAAPTRLDEAPDLIVEVLSPASKPLDLITKRDAYERFGVGEYWVADPDERRVRCWQRRHGGFVEAGPSSKIECASIGGVVVDVAGLWPAADG